MANELPAGMTARKHATPVGDVWLVAKTEHPSNLLIHGLMRGPRALARWTHVIPDVGILVLPNHANAGSVAERSPRGYAEALRYLVKTFPEPPFIIGESLGAVIGFTLPSRGMVAVEPPLSVDNLWPLHRTIAAARARGLAVGDEVEAMFSEPFHWALERVSSPTLVIAGDVPLLPPRDVWPEPSLITDADAAAFAAHPLVEVRRIPGGHALLDTNPQAVLREIRAFAARVDQLDASR